MIVGTVLDGKQGMIRSQTERTDKEGGEEGIEEECILEIKGKRTRGRAGFEPNIAS